MVFLICALTQITGCKKVKVEISTTLEVMKLGTTDFYSSLWGIRGFNHKGNPIILAKNGFLYEWNDQDNSFRQLGPTPPLNAEFAVVAQDGLGDYYIGGGDIYKLNPLTNLWELVSIASGLKGLLANQNGDLLVYINDGGNESLYMKKSNDMQWSKIIDKPSNIDNISPKFFSNSGVVFFGTENRIDGYGSYYDYFLNTKTREFKKLYDASDPANFDALSGANTWDYVTPEGIFYVSRKRNPMCVIYKLNSSAPNPVFEKVTEFNLTYAAENNIAMDIDRIVVNESTSKIKVAAHCYNGLSPHWNLGETKNGSTKLTMQEHDGGERQIFVSPNGKVFILRGSFFYLWK